MSILIKGMEMPTSCGVCPLMRTVEYEEICPLLGEYGGMYDRNDDCPLTELPPHGRLIDADELMKMCGMATDCYDCPNGEHGWCKRSQDAANICEAIDDAPTIIEAEGASDGI